MNTERETIENEQAAHKAYVGWKQGKSDEVIFPVDGFKAGWQAAIANMPKAEPVIKWVGTTEDTTADNHPNDKEPRCKDLRALMGRMGDDTGQGLHPYWKWAMATGFNAAKRLYQKEIPPTPSPSNVLVEALRDLLTLAKDNLNAGNINEHEAYTKAEHALATYSASTDSVSISRSEYEAMKDNAERLKQFEAWADEGLCPVLIFNDNGYWAVSFNGSGELDLNEPPIKPLAFTTWVEPAEWRETVSEAIDTARKSS